MKTPEERIEELEKRVSRLEKEVSIKVNIPLETAPKRHRERHPSKVRIPEEKDNKKHALKEEVVGKYIVGALASLLIFIGAISLVILLWDKITPKAKLTMLVTVSILTTILGYLRILKEKNHINSIILGTGVGLLFISILSSYIYFGYISSNIAFILAGLWSILFILSYKYTRTYFTTVIAYIGSYIATLLGLSLVLVSLQVNVILIFVTSISLALIVSGYWWLSKKEQLVNLGLSSLSYISLLFWLWIQRGFNTIEINYMTYLGLLAIVIYILTNLSNNIMDKLVRENKEYKMVALISNIIIASIVGLCLISVLKDLGRNIFIILSLTSIIFNEYKNKNIRRILTIINSSFIALVIIQSSQIVTHSIFALLALMIFIMIIEKNKLTNDYEKLRIGLIVLSMFELVENLNIDKINMFVYFISLVALVLLVGKMLIDKYRINNRKNIISFKLLGYLLVIQTVILFTSEAIYRINNGLTGTLIEPGPIIYTLVTIKIIAIFKIGYFKDWFNLEFKWFKRNLKVKEDKSYIAFFITNILMYIIGLFIIILRLNSYSVLLMLISTVAIMVIQTIEVFKFKDKSEFIGVVEGLKYLIYTWVLMVSLLNFQMSSLSTSIAGLMIALVSIVLGFNKKMKGLRLYGLVVTLLMVFKVITIDMGGQNSITRVISLIVGGLICFVISIIYNKIDKNIED